MCRMLEARAGSFRFFFEVRSMEENAEDTEESRSPHEYLLRTAPHHAASCVSLI